MPRITGQFKSSEDVGWYGSSYLLASSITIPLISKFHRLPWTGYALIFTILIFELGCLLCAVAPHSWLVILGRATSGSGAAAFISAAFMYSSDITPKPKVATVNGVMALLLQIGRLVGPL